MRRSRRLHHLLITLEFRLTMRARHAVIPALILLALAGTGCGGSDEDPAATATPITGAAVDEQPDTGTGDDGTLDGTTTPTTTSETPHADTGITTEDSITTQLSKNPDLRTLSTVVNAAALADTLDSGDYTLFAPNNDAFTKLGTQLDALLQPTGKVALQNILKFHIVKGRIREKSLRDGQLLTTLQGTRLRVSIRDGQYTIGNSLTKGVILVPNAKASNGIIHTIDTVLKPKTGA
ncbi:MAG: fasciclin domain-containing protein [Solirubrobacteraceae bacterium]|nr:fasciclin domain-containing protein [Solirubrobacteraceae bacterium]